MPKERFRLLPEMEGRTARWYARNRGTPSQMALYPVEARRWTEGLPEGAQILEIAPGPGYLAVEIARLGRFRVSGLDVSRTMVEIARENAAKAGVVIDFRWGDAAALPFADSTFDRILCQAAFKNFAAPRHALTEMHRVLKPGGIAIIQDLNPALRRPDLDHAVRAMQLGSFGTFMTKLILGTVLRRRAFSEARFHDLAAETPFRTAEIQAEGIGLEVRLIKSVGNTHSRDPLAA
jgi:ubiquinone/menaquinone biosynthesis C-methylase UbiE